MAEGTQPQLGSMTSDALQERTGRVLPMPALSPPGVTCNSLDCELLIQRLMEVVRPGRSGIQERPQGPDTGPSEIVVRLTLEGESGLGGTPAGLATTVGGRPWIFLDLRCPGLSGTGEPLFYEGWTV